jgi:hypothetical protein
MLIETNTELERKKKRKQAVGNMVNSVRLGSDLKTDNKMLRTNNKHFPEEDVNQAKAILV